MGEIADAIRRARGGQPLAVPAERSERASSAFRGLPTAPLSPPASSPAGAPELGHAVDSVEPQNQAVVLEDGPNAEICRHLALRLRSALDRRGVRSAAIVSAERGDGKTTVACNLAIALASLSRSREVALVDFDLRKPAIGPYLNLRRSTGIEEVLHGRADLDAATLNVQHPAIDVFPVAAPQRAAHELFVQPRVAEVIRELERRYATVIVDTPPAPLVPDASLILRHVAVCVPVVRTGKTRARSLRRLLDCLPADRIAGWILNCEKASSFQYGGYEYAAESETSLPEAEARA